MPLDVMVSRLFPNRWRNTEPRLEPRLEFGRIYPLALTHLSSRKFPVSLAIQPNQSTTAATAFNILRKPAGQILQVNRVFYQRFQVFRLKDPE